MAVGLFREESLTLMLLSSNSLPGPVIELLALSPKPILLHSVLECWGWHCASLLMVCLHRGTEHQTRKKQLPCFPSFHSFLPASPHKSPLLWQKLSISVATGSSFQVFPHSQNQPHHGLLKYVNTNYRHALLRAYMFPEVSTLISH